MLCIHQSQKRVQKNPKLREHKTRQFNFKIGEKTGQAEIQGRNTNEMKKICSQILLCEVAPLRSTSYTDYADFFIFI